MQAARKLATGRVAKVAHEKLGVAVQAALPALRAQSLPPPSSAGTRFGEVPLDLPENPD